MRAAGALVAGLVMALAVPAWAHELVPGLARLVATEPGVFELTWRPPKPAQDDLRVTVAAPCEVRAEAGALTVIGCPAGETPTLRRRGGVGAEVLVAGPDAGQVRLLPPGDDAAAPELTVGAVLAEYAALGVQHILLGLDHLAFVLGLLLLVRAPRRAVAVLTAFTVGHSVTLAAAALGAARLPAAPVEATIALSVVFVAREALVAAPGRGAVPLVAALGFGLLHGFGFAGALAALGLPRGHALPALFAFNVGVELGQLLVVGGVIAALWATGLLRQANLRRPAAFVLGVGAALLALERVWEVLRWT